MIPRGSRVLYLSGFVSTVGEVLLPPDVLIKVETIENIQKDIKEFGEWVYQDEKNKYIIPGSAEIEIKVVSTFLDKEKCNII